MIKNSLKCLFKIKSISILLFLFNRLSFDQASTIKKLGIVFKSTKSFFSAESNCSLDITNTSPR